MNDVNVAPTQLLAQAWQSCVPVQLTLANDNISSPQAVRPLYVSGLMSDGLLHDAHRGPTWC